MSGVRDVPCVKWSNLEAKLWEQIWDWGFLCGDWMLLPFWGENEWARMFWKMGVHPAATFINYILYVDYKKLYNNLRGSVYHLWYLYVQPTNQPMITVVKVCQNWLDTHIFEERVSSFIFERWVFFDPEDGGSRPPPYLFTRLHRITSQ